MDWILLGIIIILLFLGVYSGYISNPVLLELIILSFIATVIFLFIGCLVVKQVIKRTSVFGFLKERPIGRFCSTQYWRKALEGFDIVWLLTYIYVISLFILGTLLLKALEVLGKTGKIVLFREISIPATITIMGHQVYTWTCIFAGVSGFVFSWFVFMILVLYSSYISLPKIGMAPKSFGKIIKVVIDIILGIFGGGVVVTLLNNIPSDKVVLYSYVVYGFALLNIVLTFVASNSLVEAYRITQEENYNQKIQIDPIWEYLEKQE